MKSNQGNQTLTARWLFPADGPPLPGGTITIHGDKIIAVEPAGTRAADEDLGNVAILPGFVNAHTHLDLSDARGKIPPTPNFTAWLRGVIEHRRGQTLDAKVDAIRAGLDELLAHGTTLVGDIAAGGWSLEVLEGKLWAVVFFEMIGLSKERALDSLQRTKSFLFRQIEDYAAFVQQFFSSNERRETVESFRIGISPHAPYSVRDSLMRSAAALARKRRLVSAIHLAESATEQELLEGQRGPLLDFLKSLDVWSPDGLVASCDDVPQFFWPNRTLFIHANYLPPTTPLAEHHTIVFCPRTHAAFGHPTHPFREFMKRGVRVVLGTDSLASNPDLDILAEARFVHARHPDLPGETLLRMITLDGAIALGWGDVTGSLTPGKSADLVVLPLRDRDEQDPYRFIFDSALAVQRVMFRGEWR